MKKQKTLFSYAERGGTSDRNSRSLSRGEEEGESFDARDESSTSEGAGACILHCYKSRTDEIDIKQIQCS